MMPSRFSSILVGSFLFMDSMMIQGSTAFTKTTSISSSFQQRRSENTYDWRSQHTIHAAGQDRFVNTKTKIAIRSSTVTTTNLMMINSLRGGGGGGEEDTTDANNKNGYTTTTTPGHNLHMLQGMMFSGQFLPNLRRLFAGGAESYGRGWNAVAEAFHGGDIFILVMWSFLPVPLMKIFYKFYCELAQKITKKESTTRKEYERSKTFKVATFISQGGRIASIVYCLEMITTFCINVMAKAAATSEAKKALKAAPQVVPKSLVPLQKFPGLVANCLYGYWLATNLVKFKKRLLRPILYRKLPDSDTVDSLLNYMIYGITTILILEASSFDFTALVKSLVAVGGLSSLVVGLALREPVSQLLQGILMMASMKFRRNEEIRLGDGTQGKVVDIGLLETTLQGGDNIQVKIPHSKLTGQKFANLSRMKKSQTKFELRFHLYDMERVDEIIDAIRTEIMNACPNTLIQDGSQPFRVCWTDIKNDHFVILIDARHNVPPTGNAYYETRQQVLKAISKATQKARAKLALPMQLEANFKIPE